MRYGPDVKEVETVIKTTENRHSRHSTDDVTIFISIERYPVALCSNTATNFLEPVDPHHNTHDTLHSLSMQRYVQNSMSACLNCLYGTHCILPNSCITNICRRPFMHTASQHLFITLSPPTHTLFPFLATPLFKAKIQPKSHHLQFFAAWKFCTQWWWFYHKTHHDCRKTPQPIHPSALDPTCLLSAVL